MRFPSGNSSNRLISKMYAVGMDGRPAELEDESTLLCCDHSMVPAERRAYDTSRHLTLAVQLVCMSPAAQRSISARRHV